MSDLTELVRIADPQFYLDDPYPVFARMRAEDPVHYRREFDTFVITRHADVKAISANTATFTTANGTFLHDTQARCTDELSVLDSFFPHGAENLGTTDGLRHRELRQAISPAFGARTMRGLEATITRFCDELIEPLAAGNPGDWLTAATMLPVRVVCELVGLPESDADLVLGWTDEVEKIGDDAPIEELRAIGIEFAKMKDYVLHHYNARKKKPGPDMLSTLAKLGETDESLGEANIMMLAMLVTAAAGGTTRALLLALIMNLATRPDQLARVRSDRSLVPGAVEEALRWIPPVRAFLRTAVHDTVLHGTRIGRGQHVYLMYMAANRDGNVFTNPETFDVSRRENNQQLAFGFGEHFCIGAPLARLEGEIMLNRLLDRFSTFDLLGEPKPVASVFRNSWLDMPVVFHP
jgi:cytochrome P450